MIFNLAGMPAILSGFGMANDLAVIKMFSVMNRKVVICFFVFLSSNSLCR